MRTLFGLLFVLTAVLGFCGGGQETMLPSDALGTLVFTANGEDFVRQGFVDRQGWQIEFEHVYVNLVHPTAYTPAGREVVLQDAHWLDLAAGGPEAPPVEVGRVQRVRPDNYQSLKFRVRKVSRSEYEGSSIVMIGLAEREGMRVPFEIRLNEEMDYDGREGYVGEDLKGLVLAGGEADVEMTFHFDHIFGDYEAPADDHVNAGSVGFDFFHQFVRDGHVKVTQCEMANAEGYRTLVKALWNLGHLGEGHCEVSNQSSAGHI